MSCAWCPGSNSKGLCRVHKRVRNGEPQTHACQVRKGLQKEGPQAPAALTLVPSSTGIQRQGRLMPALLGQCYQMVLAGVEKGRKGCVAEGRTTCCCASRDVKSLQHGAACGSTTELHGAASGISDSELIKSTSASFCLFAWLVVWGFAHACRTPSHGVDSAHHLQHRRLPPNVSDLVFRPVQVASGPLVLD